MLGFSRKVDLALLVVAALAGERRGFVSVRELARAHHLPYRFASQVTGCLKKQGILEAREGVGGGYRLARQPAAITLYDVVGAFEARVPLVACLDARLGFHCPQKAWCGAKGGVGIFHRRFLASLRQTTIADLLPADAEH